MFGYTSVLRAGLSRLLMPKYSAEDFDAIHGVDTSTVALIDSQMPPESMAEAVRYEPANVGVLHHIFRSLPLRHQEYHLIDLGCGKGRTLLVASQYPFRKITGVELSPLTVRIAARNLERNTRRHTAQCKDVDVRCENAATFHMPPGNLLVTMYNPFLGKTFEQVVQNLHAAALTDPARRILIAYINPWLCEQTLEKSGCFHKVQEHRPIPRQWAWSLWQHV
jgi:SAM-dependent methyltransferase